MFVAGAPPAQIGSRSRLVDSVALPGSSIGHGCRLTRTILGPWARLPDGAIVGEDPVEDARWFRRTAGGTTLVTAAMLERRAAGHGQTVHAA